jgi:phosphoserine phosphatase RsbU/P
MTSRALDATLARQLKRLKLDAASGPASTEAWAELLEQINERYHHMNDDRALLNRSLELSTLEMETLRRRVEAQRDRLSGVVGTIGEALSQFGAVAQAGTTQIGAARTAFATRLQAILSESSAPEDTSSDVSLIRTNLVRLADQLVVLLADTAERAALRKELEVARAVQQLLVPADNEIERGRLAIVGHFQPAAECGGDWWTVSDLAAGKVVTVVGDVTGHGVAAAIITGAAKAAYELAIEVTHGALDAAQLLALMNAALFRTARRQIMMTCNVTIIDPVTGALTLANAGHPNPILIRQGIIHPLMAEGAPLGAAADTAYQQVQLAIEPGDVLVCFTDGIIECENAGGEQFSERRLRAICQRAAPGGAHKVRDAVLDALTAFRGDAPQGDDLTLVATAFR